MDRDLHTLLDEFRVAEAARGPPALPLRIIVRLVRALPQIGLLAVLCGLCLWLFPWWVLPAWFGLGFAFAAFWAFALRGRRR